jgi:putative tryptophan/tyrosine transport system permease protein
MELWIGALNLGLLYAIMTVGVYITFRIQDFPDITVDGTFALGGAVAAIIIVSGFNPILGLFAAFIAGSIAGSFTGLIYTRLKVNGLLAGIIVMIGLYSINLHIMGRSNVPLLNQPGVFDYVNAINPGLFPEIWNAIILTAVMMLFWLVVSIFFKTDIGVTMRATGDNPTMASASGVNVNSMNIFALAMSNGLVALSGGMVAQYQGFADVGMGIGTVIIGLASVIIGESILRSRSIFVKILSAVVGSVIFRFMIAFALYAGMNPIDLKLLTAVFVLLTLYISRKLSKKDFTKKSKAGIAFLQNKKLLGAVIAGIVLIAAYFSYDNFLRDDKAAAEGHFKIGILQVSDHPLLNVTRDSFIEEMKKIGYVDGVNCEIVAKDANGDLSTINSILDKYIMDKMDLILSISTPCTQAAAGRVKDIPVVFATVANPFIIDIGTSDTDHLDNMTGVYGWASMDKTLEYARKIKPGPLTIGAIWDPAFANAVFNVDNLKKAVDARDDVKFEGVTVSNSSEVYQAAVSLCSRDIDFIILPPDNIVYAAFESVVKAATPDKIPIAISDIDRIGDGATFAYGYDYVLSGIQAAHIVHRIFDGENIKDIPFETYKKTELMINMKVVKELGLKVPGSMLAEAELVGVEMKEVSEKKKIGVVQFAMEPNVKLCKNGINAALKANGYKDGENLEIIYKNAQADFSMINSIMQDLIRRDVDIIVPLSTPCVQSAVQNVGDREKPIVCFTYIFDPYKIGAAKSPTDHLPNMTGVACFPPVEKMLDQIKEIFPDRKNIGIVWNSSEANSEAVVSKFRDYAKKIKVNIIEATVTNPSEVLDASKSLIAKGAEVFLNPGDNTLNVSFDAFAKTADQSAIPVFSIDAEYANNGALVGLGPNYFETGWDGGEYLARILDGENPAEMPIYQTPETQLLINMDLMKKHGFEIPKQVLDRAELIYHQDSDKETEKKDIALFLFNENDLLQVALNGLMDELNEDDFLEKNNLSITNFNAQNEFTVAQTIVKDIVRRKFDYIITISTPALQMMANENKKIPHVFGAVTDPYGLGVAKTSEDHQPNVTGVATFQPLESTFRVMRETFPRAKRVGIIWNPAEQCSEACTGKARLAAKQFNFDLIEMTVNSTGEIIEALNGLLNRDIELFITSGDNTVMLALPTIAKILEKKKIPYITNTFSDVELGAFLSLGADYYEVGKKTSELFKQVASGTDPKNIPINNFIPEKLYLNMKLAKEMGIKIPENVVKKANKILR